MCAIKNTIQLPLSVCYRCGKNIIAKAKKIISHIEAFDGAKDGEVKEDCKLADISDSDMVLCRQTYPLVRLCLKFLSEGKKARIMGGDIGRSLIKMVEDTKRKREEWSLENMFNRIYAEYFSDHGDKRPCRTTVEINCLPTPIAIELKCIATIKS